MNPKPLTDEETRNLEAVVAGKRSDCAFYNACLDQALSEDWAGFSCGECQAYCEPDPIQQQQNWLALRALDKAAEMLETTGRVHRKRGTKGPSVREEMLPLVAAFDE